MLMAIWGWLIGYVALFALLHLLLYYLYVRRDDGENDRAPSFADPNHASVRSPSSPEHYRQATDEAGEVDADHDRDREVDGETVTCPHCGALNESEQAFTYCWRCASGLRR